LERPEKISASVYWPPPQHLLLCVIFGTVLTSLWHFMSHRQSILRFLIHTYSRCRASYVSVTSSHNAVALWESPTYVLWVKYSSRSAYNTPRHLVCCPSNLIIHCRSCEIAHVSAVMNAIYAPNAVCSSNPFAPRFPGPVHLSTLSNVSPFTVPPAMDVFT
jgi:hypothetical protein